MHRTASKGIASLTLILSVLAVVVIAGGLFWLAVPPEENVGDAPTSLAQDEGDPEDLMRENTVGSVGKERANREGNQAGSTDDADRPGSNENEAGTAGPTEDGAQPSTAVFEGTLLAGGSSPLLDFTQEDYEEALASGRPIVLYFYATWCPACAAELPHLYGAFDDLEDDSLIGFRVNYNDGDTDSDEVALAREFGVAYQHTKVVLDANGERILKSPETWDVARYKKELAKLLP